MGIIKIIVVLGILFIIGGAIYLTFIAPVVSAGGFEYNGVNISAESYEGIKELTKGHLGANVCNIDTSQCIFVWDMENMEEVLE